MIPPTYYANMQIMQAADHVAIRHELMHDVRLIRLDGAPRPANVQWLAGDARGRWEGDTFVVETTNFTEETPFRGPPPNDAAGHRHQHAAQGDRAIHAGRP